MKPSGFPYDVVVVRVSSGRDFFALIEELLDEHTTNIRNGYHGSFFHNRDTLADAFKEGRLYTLVAQETDDMFRRGAAAEDVFVPPGSGQLFLLPCFCMMSVDNVAVEILWTHPRARMRGLASTLVKQLGAQSVRHPLPESEGFWRAKFPLLSIR